MSFVGEHAGFGPAAAFPLLTADLLDTRALGRDLAGPRLLDLIQEQATRDKPVEPLLASGLGFDLQAGWPMPQHDHVEVLLTFCPP